jgi:hypothetical protein
MVPVSLEETSTDAEEMDTETPMESPVRQKQKYTIHFPGAVKRSAYRFDGQGNFFNKDWDLSEGEGGEFCWYHVELPRSNQRLAVAAQYLIDVLCPPLKLQDILSLVSSGPFCGNVDGALVFRVNSPGPTVSKFTQRLAARISENTVIQYLWVRCQGWDFLRRASLCFLRSPVWRVLHPSPAMGKRRRRAQNMPQSPMELSSESMCWSFC